jgi:hypothetical protein
VNDPISIAALTHATITYFAQHKPWMADKVEGAVVAQPVREAWAWIKDKLQTSMKGRNAVEQFAPGCSSLPNIEAIREPLLEALQSDPDFAMKLASLIHSATGAQTVVGDHNKAANVMNSTDVSIKIN